MKIVVISDTHLRKANPDLERICDQYCRDADLVIHLGDFTSAPVLDFLEQYPLEAVAGNMDEAPVYNRLPSKKIIRAGNHRIALVHGWGGYKDLRDRLRPGFTDVDAVLYGHTHEPCNQRENGILWFNPGSFSLGRGELERSIGILEVSEDTIEGRIIAL